MANILNRDNYTVAWIAILPIEAQAALAALDKLHDGYFLTEPGDDYLYIGGEINGHNIVLTQLPAGQNYGIGAAAALVNQVKSRFDNIRFALLVGVAAGCPNLDTSVPGRKRDIRLGDVLVCIPNKAETGIVHYDLGAETEEGFVPNGRQAEPPSIVRAAIAMIQLTKTHPYRQGGAFSGYLAVLQAKLSGAEFAYPGADRDELFSNTAVTPGSKQSIARPVRDLSEPTVVWYGSIGSGNSLMRNPRRRDELRDRFDLIGLEMEAAGVMNTLPTGVIRGVCDYGDGHKTKEWQGYAAAVAAVYAKGVLHSIHTRRGEMSIELASQTNLFARTSLRVQTEGKYWEHLTLDCFRTYDRIWTSLNARYGQAISIDALAGFLEAATSMTRSTNPVSQSSVRKTWDLLREAWILYERPEYANLDLVVLPENLIVAILYMIHMEKQFPFEVPNSRRCPDVVISPERWENLTRFNQWVPCACLELLKRNCGLEWNFARVGGLSRLRSSEHVPDISSRKPCMGENRTYTILDKLSFRKATTTNVYERNREKFYAFKQLPRVMEHT